MSKCYDRGSNPQPIPDDAYFISTVVQVRDAIIKRENLSIGFRNIMKMAVTQLPICLLTDVSKKREVQINLK